MARAARTKSHSGGTVFRRPTASSSVQLVTLSPRKQTMRPNCFCATKSTAATPSRVLSNRSKGLGERSEEHTSELQSPCNLVCRLLLEKKKKKVPPPHAFPRLWSLWNNQALHTRR